MVRHRGHVHVGAATFGAGDLEDARRVHDEDSPDRDLHQLLREGVLPRRFPATMVSSTVGLVSLSLLLAVAAGPLFAFTDRAAVDLLDRTPYISAVLQEDTR